MNEESIINVIFNNFNIPLIISINASVYLIIKSFGEHIKIILKKESKILITLFSCIILGFIYYNGSNLQEIVSSCISAPLIWDWIIKPIFEKIKISYKNE